MKTVSQRNKLKTAAKPNELELQSSQPHGAGECGRRMVKRKVFGGKMVRVVKRNTQDPPKVRSLRSLLHKAEILKHYMPNVRLN